MPPSLVHLTAPPRAPGAGKPPLLLLLHGVGSNERDLFALAPQVVDPRYFVVAARGPIELQPDAHAWYRVDFTPTGITWDAAQAEASRQRLIAFLDELVAIHPVDPDRVYLLGFSQGAIMALAVALTRPEKVAGAAALSGRLRLEDLPELAPAERLAGMPVLVQHGRYDPLLPIELGRATRDQLARLPVDLAYREYPMGHHVTPESLADLSRWLRERIDGPCAS